jgi:hypothetical protein
LNVLSFDAHGETAVLRAEQDWCDLGGSIVMQRRSALHLWIISTWQAQYECSDALMKVGEQLAGVITS